MRGSAATQPIHSKDAVTPFVLFAFIEAWLV
jgi:hypothetical protein